MTPEQKRAMLARMLRQPSDVSKAAFALHGMVLSCRLCPTSHWNMSATWRFFRKVDPQMLRERLQRVIDRHPSLRTTCEVEGEQEFLARLRSTREIAKVHQLILDTRVLQRVHPSHTLDFTMVEADDWTAGQFRERLLADGLEPFDLARLPLCRLRFYRRRHDDVMQLDLHHAAADLWSLEIILAELLEPPAGPPPPSFAEFCAWQHAWFTLPRAGEMRDWWSRELQGCPDLCLPSSHSNDPVEMVHFRLDPELLARTREVGRTHKVTLFNLVLSAWQVTLGRAREQEDFALGSTSANRLTQRFENTVGHVANLIVYRRDLRQVATWEQLWARNRDSVAEAVDRQFYPLGTLLIPRMDVFLGFRQFPRARWAEGEVPRGEPVGLRSAGVVDSPLGLIEVFFLDPPLLPCPAILEITEQKEDYHGALRYRRPCLSGQEAEGYVADFLARLRESLARPQATFR